MIKTNLNAFIVDAKKLFLRNPKKFRYTLSYNDQKGYLELHCTDDTLHIKTILNNQTFYKKVERLITWMIEHMAADVSSEEVQQKIREEILAEEAKLKLHTVEI
ncbi:hypothetical protein WA158_003252 [Blastocystis sp. Blastoise]